MGFKISLIFGILLCQVFRAFCHLHGGSLGSIDFECPDGQYFTGGYCVASISVSMTWSDADRTCRRQGQFLFWALDADEHNAVDHLARSSWEYYWSGLNRREDGLDADVSKWSHSDDEVPIYEGLWENNQPDTSKGDCVFVKKNGYGSFGNCLMKLPFVCKSEAVLKGYFRCRNGHGIQNKFKCDGHNDCGDFSDEQDCDTKCRYMVDATYTTGGTKPSGIIANSNTFYANSKTCDWFIVTNIGTTIKVLVTSFNTEKNADTMEFRTGGLEGEILLEELTGNVQTPKTYYSSDNVFIVKLRTDSTVLKSGFSISWTTDVSEISNEMTELTATSSSKDLKSPFYDTGYLPHEKVLEWQITAETESVVTLKFENLDIGKDGMLYLWDGEDLSLKPTFSGVESIKNDIFISKSKSVRLMLMSGKEELSMPKGIYIKYWQGCDVDYMVGDGTLQSPGFNYGSYPDNVNCTWIIQRPSSETRAMSLIFNSFDIQSVGDYLQIFNDTNSALHTGDGYTGTDSLTSMVVRSTTGYIKVVFRTNFVLTGKGFEADFSLDCPDLSVSPETNIISTDMYETSFMSHVTMGCQSGSSFVQEEFNSEPTMLIMCEKGGKWNVSRIPNCNMTYCPIPPQVSNGFIVKSSGVMYGGNVTYQCYVGFTMANSPTIECQADGTWESPPDCNADNCPALVAPTNGNTTNLEGNGREFASVVRYVCNPGYETYGNITTYCKTGGIWSHTPPTCEPIRCPLPRIRHGTVDTQDALLYKMTTVLTCDTGFEINGTSDTMTTLTCETDGMLMPDVECVDINECDGTPCPNTENCHNTFGSHLCTCKTGYERLSPSADCTDINECSSNNGKGPCDQTCTDEVPGYTCSCPNNGYLLYEGDGFNNISVAEGDTGMREGDIYHIGHTCIRIKCPVPTPPSHGQILSKKDLFFFNDKVEYVCDHGFKMMGIHEVVCGHTGNWLEDVPTCEVANCTTPSISTIERSTNIYPGESLPVPYGTKVNIECQYGSMIINRTLYCSYKGNNEYDLLGDSPVCPEIDCEKPENLPGSNYTGLTSTNLGSSFTFGCEVGFTESGMSLDGTSTVTCQENGRWNIGNLTCTGGKCSDPGTPGGATQVVRSYEVGELLSFNCSIDGYFPDPPESLECIVDTDTLSNNITWNSTVLPECKDKMPPVFTNCPMQPIYVDKTEIYSYAQPMATDNSGAVKMISNPEGYRSGLRTNIDMNITYTAEDFSGNKKECVIEIKIKDYANPELLCPDNVVEYITTPNGQEYNVSKDVSVNSTREDVTLTYTPSESITVDHTTIGVLKVVNVSAVDKWGAEDRCSYIVETRAHEHRYKHK